MGTHIRAFSEFLDGTVWKPVEAILSLREVTPSVDLAILSHLNAVPEFVATCQGFRGKDKKKLGCASGNEYKYIEGIRRLIELDPIPNGTREIEKAKFLYQNLRCQIAHSILAKKVVILTEPPSVNGNKLSEFGSGWIFRAEGTKPIEECDIERLMIHAPLFYREIRGGAERYIQGVRDGACTFTWSR